MKQKEADMADTFYSIRQVADRLGVRWYRVKYARQAGHVQEPMRVGNTRFYADADIGDSKSISLSKGVTMKQEFRINGKTYPVWLNQKGYACVTINEDGQDRAYLLHRLAWERENGPVPD